METNREPGSLVPRVSCVSAALHVSSFEQIAGNARVVYAVRLRPSDSSARHKCAATLLMPMWTPEQVAERTSAGDDAGCGVLDGKVEPRSEFTPKSNTPELANTAVIARGHFKGCCRRKPGCLSCCWPVLYRETVGARDVDIDAGRYCDAARG